MTSDHVLVHYEPKKSIIVVCDAFPFGVREVPSYTEDGVERPVTTASRTLTGAKKNYSQIEEEGFTIMSGVTKFDKFLYYRKGTLFRNLTRLS